MKTLTKLALVSAMAFSANAMAAQLQALDEEEMSAATGQDGITISLLGNVAIDKVVVHDKNGYQALTAPTTPTRAALGFDGGGVATAAETSGAIVLGNATNATGNDADPTNAAYKGFLINTNGGLDLVIDADGNKGAPVLNVNVALKSGTVIKTGDIYVATSTRDTSHAAATTNLGNHGTGTAQAKILDSISVTLGTTTLNVQLGNAPQGAMIQLDSTMTGGLTIDNLSLYDNRVYTTSTTPALSTGITSAATDRGIHIGKVNVSSETNGDLVLDAGIGIVDQGLLVSSVGTLNVGLVDVKLGSKAGAASIGDIALVGLHAPQVLIRGH